MDDPEIKKKAEVNTDNETLLASPHPDLAPAEDKQAESSPYVYKPLATPDTIRIFRLYAGTGDKPLRGEFVYTELGESAVTYDDRQRLEPELFAHKYEWEMVESPLKSKEVEDLASLLQQYDRRATLANPKETFSAFQDRNGISERRWSCWRPRLWVPYEALSYIWGEPMLSEVINTSDGSILITPNLADALHHLRRPLKPRNLWIDALCINQKDNSEKGPQVRGMGRVYASAEGVLVWLGPDPSKIAERIFSQIRTACEMFESPKINLAEYMRKTGSSGRQVFEMSWFSRLWVVQELVLSYKALFCWGDAQVDRDFMVFVSRFNQERTWLKHIHTFTRPVPTLLRHTRDLSCSDQRDRIYGLLGLCSKSHSLSRAVSELTPDYSRKVIDVFTDVACLFIDHASSFELLVQVDASSGNDAGLPSWVPDWRLPETSCIFWYIDMALFGARISLQPRSAVADRSTGILSMYGIKLDSLLESMLYPFHADDMPTMLSAMTVVWIKLISVVPLQSLAFGELALLRLLGGLECRDVLSKGEHYFEGRNVPELSGPRKLSHAVRAMMRSLLQVANKVQGAAGRYFVDRPSVSKRDWKGRKLFLTLSGLLGIGPMGMEARDEFILFHEQGRPFLGIVRRGHESYRFIGTAFVPTICESGLEDSYKDPWHYDDGDTYVGRLRALWEARAQDIERFDIK